MNNIELFFSCDDGYIPFLAVTLQSIKENSSKDNLYISRVLHANSINEQNQAQILKDFNKDNMVIEFVDITDKVQAIANKLHTRDYYSKSTYYRLFIPNLYPDLDKALYLDADIVLLDDVANLFNIDLGDNLVGGVTDGAIANVDEFKEYVEKRIGVAHWSHYFNAGVLPMNLKALRQTNFEDKFLDILQKVTFNVAQDQDYLNTICKGRVQKIDDAWDVMPFPGTEKPKEQLKLVHYNLAFKPWHIDNVVYQDYFWDFASRTSYFETIKQIKANYDTSLQEKSQAQTINLIKLAKEQADDEKENVRVLGLVEESLNMFKTQKSIERLKVLQKISDYEKQGCFDKDVEEDPANKVLLSNDVDYLQKKLYTRVKRRLAYYLGDKYLKRLIKNKKLIIKNIIGAENWQNVDSGAVITCNHFNAMDSFAMQIAYQACQPKNKKMYKVVREGNYTNFPGFYGMLMRNCDTLPLSSSPTTMKNFIGAVNQVLQNGDNVLFYPEQSMWWNYKKPKPLKNGAFKFAAENNVPIVPCFITFEDSDIIGEDGFNVQEYTIHIFEPLYANKLLPLKEQIQDLKKRNYELWKKCYEDCYQTSLKFTAKLAVAN